MKKRYCVLIVTIFFLLLANKSIVLAQSSNLTASPFFNDFNFDWQFKLIFSPKDIPLPASTQNFNATVKAVYSPSVVKFQGKYYMFFGVSIYCIPSGVSVARDSIAVATSNDGVTWTFLKYVLEPDKITCLKPPTDWMSIVSQVNDPTVIINPSNSNQLLLFYTSVIYPNQNIGNIGIVHLDNNLNITFRNDKYLSGSSALWPGGFSRPAIEWINPTTTKLWFDSGGKIGSASINSLSQLSNTNIQNENLAGVDIDLPLLSYTQRLILMQKTAAGIQAYSKNVGASWGNIWNFTKLSGQAWDTWYQGSPDLFLDKDKCQPVIYLSGAVKDTTGSNNPYSSISIGEGLPISTKKFYFPICINTMTPTPFLKMGDINSDSRVDILDIGVIIDNYNRTPITNPRADINHDNHVDILDIGSVIDNYGR